MMTVPRENVVAGSPALGAENVCRSYTTGKQVNPVLQDISVQIFPSELTLVVGPSGSGKSTLLAILSGLLRPDAGQVQALGIDLWSLESSDLDRFRQDHCGFVFQGFNLFSALTALEQVMLPLKYLGWSKEAAKAAAVEYLEEFGLSKQIDLRPVELSGGEKQRVAIARALVKEPALVFADEPTSALDSENGRIVIALLRRCAHTQGAAVLAVSHDPRLIQHADRVIHLEDGKILYDERCQVELAKHYA